MPGSSAAWNNPSSFLGSELSASSFVPKTFFFALGYWQALAQLSFIQVQMQTKAASEASKPPGALIQSRGATGRTFIETDSGSMAIFPIL